jgi:hypothetical protein
VLFDLRHGREDDAVVEYVSIIAGRHDCVLARYFDREESQNWGFILAEEMILRARYYDAAILLVNIIRAERRYPVFGILFFPEVITLTKSILLHRLKPRSNPELVLDAWEYAAETGIDEATDEALEQLIAEERNR